MASGEEILSALARLGFDNTGIYYYGVWKEYAVTLRRITAKSFFADLAVRLDKIPTGLRKALAAAVKEKGLKIGGAEAITKTSISFSFSFGKNDEAEARLTERLDTMVAALRENGIAPADTCALSGAADPDSLCLVPRGSLYSFQPVNAALIRQQSTQTREQAQENEVNGSYATGIVGAVLGMLVGLIPNLLTIVFTERIYGLLFALVPICAMFGYKLFKGKMGKASIAIVIVLSLLGVVLIPYLELVYYLVKDSGFPLGQAFDIARLYMTEPEFLGALKGDLLQLLLFMVIGIAFAWRYMSSQTNSSTVQSAEAQLSTLRPNPARRTEEDVYSRF